MNVKLGQLKPGQWRDLSVDEMAQINQAVQGSSKTAVNTAQPKQQDKSAPKTPQAKPLKASVKRESKKRASANENNRGKKTHYVNKAHKSSAKNTDENNSKAKSKSRAKLSLNK